MPRAIVTTVVRDAALVSIAASATWVALTLAYWVYAELSFRYFWIDRAEYFVAATEVFLVFAGVGAMLGLLASIPSRIPRTGVPIFWCCVFIAGVAFVVRVATTPSISKMSPLPEDYIAALKIMSYTATLVSAVMASAALTAIAPLYGRWCGRRGDPTHASG